LTSYLDDLSLRRLRADLSALDHQMVALVSMHVRTSADLSPTLLCGADAGNRQFQIASSSCVSAGDRRAMSDPAQQADEDVILSGTRLERATAGSSFSETAGYLGMEAQSSFG